MQGRRPQSEALGRVLLLTRAPILVASRAEAQAEARRRSGGIARSAAGRSWPSPMEERPDFTALSWVGGEAS